MKTKSPNYNATPKRDIGPYQEGISEPVIIQNFFREKRVMFYRNKYGTVPTGYMVYPNIEAVQQDFDLVHTPHVKK